MRRERTAKIYRKWLEMQAEIKLRTTTPFDSGRRRAAEAEGDDDDDGDESDSLQDNGELQ
jgi:hypothetical protein